MIQACDVQQLEFERSRQSGIHDPMTIRDPFCPAIEEEYTERGNVLHIYLNLLFSKTLRVADLSPDSGPFGQACHCPLFGELKFAAAR
jgi:hypothetical protein